MKNYNWLLWGAAAFLVVRYLKKKNGGASITTAPQELQPQQSNGLPNKAGTSVVGTVNLPFARVERASDIVSTPTPPSQGFKPGQL